MPALNIEQVLHDIGGFGTYQKILCFFLIPCVSCVCAATFSAHMFSLVTPDHWCANSDVTSLREQLPLSAEDSKKFSLPPVTYGLSLLKFWDDEVNVSVTYSKCQRYDGNLIAAYIEWITDKKPDFSLDNDKPITNCDEGWEYNITLLFSTLVNENDWVCDQSWKVLVMHVTFWLSAAFGVLVIHIFAERFGRSVGIIIMLFLTLFGHVMVLSTSGFVLLLLSRLFLGMGYSSLRFLLLIQVKAILPAKYHHYPVIGTFMTQTLVYLLMTCLLLIVNSWWWFHVPAVIISLVCTLLTFRYLEESPWWLLHKNHSVQSYEVLKKIATTNGYPLSYKHSKLLHNDFVLFQAMESSSNSANLRSCCWKQKEENFDLLESKIISKVLCKKHNMFLTLTWIVSSICYYGHWQSCILESSPPSPTMYTVFSSCFYTTLAEIPCWIILYIHVNESRYIHRSVMVISFIVMMCLNLIAALLELEGGEIMALFIINVIMRLTVTSTMITILHLSYELKISNHCVTNTNLAKTEFSVVVFTMVAPIISIMNEYNTRLPSLVFGFVAFTGALVSLGVPNQKNSNMQEKIKAEEDKDGHRNRCWFNKFSVLFKNFRFKHTLKERSNNGPISVASSVPYNQLHFT